VRTRKPTEPDKYVKSASRLVLTAPESKRTFLGLRRKQGKRPLLGILPNLNGDVSRHVSDIVI